MSDSNFKKAFDIGRIPKNIDLSSPPVTGFDYLYRVRLETRKCPKVVVSNMDTTRFLARQTVQVDPYNGFLRARPGFEPDPAWQDDQIETFCSARMEVFQNREVLKERFEKRDLPKIAKEEEWCLFCLGSKLSDKIFSSSSAETSAVDAKCSVIPDESPEQPKSKKSRCEAQSFSKTDKTAESSGLQSPGNPPLLSIMLYLNQTRITRLLAYHVSWLEDAGFSDEQGRWLYALLVCLEKPLDPDTCSLLRSLSRICSQVRANLVDPEDELLLSLNLILSIISRFFDQKDMSDCFPTD